MSNQMQYVIVQLTKDGKSISKRINGRSVNVIPGTYSGPNVFKISGKSEIVIQLSHGIQTLLQCGSMCPIDIRPEVWNASSPIEMQMSNSKIQCMLRLVLYCCGMFSDAPQYADCLYEHNVMKMMSGFEDRNYFHITQDMYNSMVSFINRIEQGWHNATLEPNAIFEHVDGSFVVADSYIDIGCEKIPIIEPDFIEDEIVAEIPVIVKDESCVVGLVPDRDNASNDNFEDMLDGVHISNPDVRLPEKCFSSMLVVDVYKNKIKPVTLYSYVDVFHYFNSCSSPTLNSILDGMGHIIIKDYYNCIDVKLRVSQVNVYSDDTYVSTKEWYYRIFGDFSVVTKHAMIWMLIMDHDLSTEGTRPVIVGDLQYGYYMMSEAFRQRGNKRLSTINLRRSRFTDFEYGGLFPIYKHRTSGGCEDRCFRFREPYNYDTMHDAFGLCSKRDKSKSYLVWGPDYNYPKGEMIDLASYKTPLVILPEGVFGNVVVCMSPKYNKKKYKKCVDAELYRLWTYPNMFETYYNQLPPSKQKEIKKWKRSVPRPDWVSLYHTVGYSENPDQVYDQVTADDYWDLWYGVGIEPHRLDSLKTSSTK